MEGLEGMLMERRGMDGCVRCLRGERDDGSGSWVQVCRGKLAVLISGRHSKWRLMRECGRSWPGTCLGRDGCVGIWCKRRRHMVEPCWCRWCKGGGRDLRVAWRDVHPPNLRGCELGLGELRAKKTEFLFVHVAEMVDCLAMSCISLC